MLTAIQTVLSIILLGMTAGLFGGLVIAWSVRKILKDALKRLESSANE